MRILFRYILMEHIPPFIFGLLVFTFLLFLGELFEVSQLIITKQIDPSLVIKLFLSLIPPTLNFTLPLATLMAILLAWGRLRADNEVTAILANGISLAPSFVLMVICGLVLSLGSLALNETLLPWSNYNLQRLQAQILQSQSAFCLEEKTFLKIGDMVLYINQIDEKKNRLEGIYIYEKKGELAGEQQAIFARSGQIKKRDNQLILKLKNGAVHEVDEKEPSKYHLLSFNLHTITVDLGRAITDTNPPKKIESMNSSELAREIEKCRKQNLDPIPLLIEKYKKTSFPFACLVFVLVGFPMAFLARHKEKSLGFGLCLLLAFAYYLFLIVGEALAERLILLPSWAMWLPNGILGVVGLFLLFLLRRK